MKRQRVIFRADGNAKVGLGHVSRCLALAEMLSTEFACVFALVNPPESVLSLLNGQFPLIPIPETDKAGELLYLKEQVVNETDIMVLDGYHFCLEYQQEIKSRDCALVCIDDLQQVTFVADAVINHAPGVTPEGYRTAPYTQLCLGLDYALLRAPFLEASRSSSARQNSPEDQKLSLLITFGGADRNNLCEKITRLCLEIPEVESIAVIPGAGSNPEFFSGKKATDSKVHIYRNLTAAEMCALMLQSQVMLAPASTLVLEGMATFLPVLCGYYVPAQELPYQKLKAAGCITPMGDWNLVTKAGIRFALANLPKMPVSVIDGQQPERFRKLFRSLQKQTLS